MYKLKIWQIRILLTLGGVALIAIMFFMWTLFFGNNPNNLPKPTTVSTPETTAQIETILQTPTPTPYIDPKAESYINIDNAKSILVDQGTDPKVVEKMDNLALIRSAYKDEVITDQWIHFTSLIQDELLNEAPINEVTNWLSEVINQAKGNNYESIKTLIQTKLSDWKLSSLHDRELNDIYNDTLLLLRVGEDLTWSDLSSLLKSEYIILLEYFSGSSSGFGTQLSGVPSNLPQPYEISFNQAEQWLIPESALFAQYSPYAPTTMTLIRLPFSSSQKGIQHNWEAIFAVYSDHKELVYLQEIQN